MTLPTFGLIQPETLPKALRQLEETPAAAPIAGGTCLLVELRKRAIMSDDLLDLSRIRELRQIRIEGDELVLGATATIADVLDSTAVRDHAPVLYEACRTFAAPLIRNRATVGGNLAHGSPAADTAPPLLLYDAMVELQAHGRKRLMPLNRFFAGPCTTNLRPGHLVTAIRLPIEGAPARWTYEKLRLRQAGAISVASVAVLSRPGDDGGTETRIALGAVAPTPIRAWDAEEALRGVTLSDHVIEVAATIAAEETRPITDIRGTADHRRRGVKILLRRALTRLMEQYQEETDAA